MRSMEKIGRSMAKTIRPTTAPTARIINGSKTVSDEFGCFINVRFITIGNIL